MKKTVGLNKELLITDELQFVLETKDGEDCLINPYQVTNVTIYFVNREFTDSYSTEYQKETLNKQLVKEYEDAKKELCKKFKSNVKVASTSNLALFGLQTVDGISLFEKDRVLVKDQINKKENGIYIVREDDWIRALDCDSSEEVLSGLYVFVDSGIESIGRGYVLQTKDPIEVGQTDLDFICFSINGSPASPDDNSINKLLGLKKEIDSSKTKSSFFYKDAVPIKVYGGQTDPDTGELFPAWLNPLMVRADLKDKVSQDNFLQQYEENDQIVEGKFTLYWVPEGCREGDYFICWSWQPNLSQEILSEHFYFSLGGDTSLTTSIPTHRTQLDKYEILLERYLPEMFKTIISSDDLTPKVLKGFNDSVARGFTVIEDMANQIIDLLDANATHETLLPLLSNMFNLKLKSSDPTLWRRQIKKAIPNFKKKGSISGLKEALSDIGMSLSRLSRIWQVASSYTFQEHFVYEGKETFDLSKNFILDDLNFELYFRPKNGQWIDLRPSANQSSSSSENHWSRAFVYFEENSFTWVGTQLEEGDSIRILYKFRNIPASEQSKENIIRLLPLLDERDERDQKYPPKNWNVRAIEEDDIYFDMLIPVRHPLSDPIVWGKIRTEFPYSENAYNMDEYNGSKRDSFNPCDIDKEFVDNCSQCQSSKFNLYLDVEKLSDESFLEAKQIVEEYMPFHSTVHTFDLRGSINEFIKPSVEKIEALVTFSTEDVLLAGEAQDLFNRSVYTTELEDIQRDLLATYSPQLNGSSDTWHGTIKNQKTVLFPSTTNSEVELNQFEGKTQGFEKANISTNNIENDPFESDNLLEILGTTNKYYSISEFDFNGATIHGNVESSLIGPLFEYRVSNKILDLNVNIIRSDQIIFKDDDADFYMLGVVTQHDKDVNGDTREAWKIKYIDKLYLILNILPDGSLLIKEESSTDPISGWELINGLNVVKESTGGTKETYNYGLVEINSPSIEVRDKIKIGDYVYLDWAGSIKKYFIKSFKNNENKFYISNYTDLDMVGENVKIYRRIFENKVGQIGYEGLEIEADDDLETLLEISNGAHQNNNSINFENIKENYLIFSDSKYYSILEIDQNKMVLSGPHNNFTISGQEIDFMILKFKKENLEVSSKVKPPYEDVPPKYKFNTIGRSGGSIITSSESPNGQVFMSTILNSNSNPVDFVNQSESIDFNIEYKE